MDESTRWVRARRRTNWLRVVLFVVSFILGWFIAEYFKSVNRSSDGDKETSTASYRAATWGYRGVGIFSPRGGNDY